MTTNAADEHTRRLREHMAAKAPQACDDFFSSGLAPTVGLSYRRKGGLRRSEASR